MAGVNPIARRVARNTLYADIKALITSSVSFNAGDLLIMNTSSHIVALPASETDGANFIGVAVVTVVSGQVASAISTDVDASVAAGSIPGPEFGDEYKVILSAGLTAHPGDKLYLDPTTGSRNVAVTGTKPVGIYVGATITAVTGGSEIVAKLGVRYPSDALIF